MRKARTLKEVCKPLTGPGSDRHKPRQGDRHKTPRHKRSTPQHQTLFLAARFVAWDGEGVTYRGPEAQSRYLANGGNLADLDDPANLSWHEYTSLGAGWLDDSDTWVFHTLVNPDQSRLTTAQIFAFLLEISKLAGYAIHVGYYLGYDFTHMLYDVDAKEALNATTPNALYPGRFGKYWFKMPTPKELLMGRGKGESIHLWDCAGFFQNSFVVTVEKWLGKDYPDLPLLRNGKAGRGQFVDWNPADIERYNQAELKALVLIMDTFRDACREADYTIARWDGAGALATAFYKKHLPKDWYKLARTNTPDPVWFACLAAYFGGRIEFIRYGVHKGYLWHGDINSAYPSAMADLPDLTAGLWIHEQSPETLQDFALYYVRWSGCVAGIGPFPFRLDNGYVIFPESGENWVWGIELQAALHLADDADKHIEIIEGWIFKPDNPDDKPFSFIRALYALRQQAVNDAKRGNKQADGLQKVLKLGLNALYGKTIQRLGWALKKMTVQKRQFQNEIVSVPVHIDKDSYPAYYHPAVGGYITAACRAKLLEAASSNPGSIVCFATDGIYAIRPLKVDAPKEKILGAWEVEELPETMFVMVQPGVYYVKYGDRWSETIRGFTKAAKAYQSFEEQNRLVEERVKEIRKAYRSIGKLGKNAGVYLPEIRLITLKAALAGNWLMRGQFISKARLLSVFGASTKRDASMENDRSPANNLVFTRPNGYLKDFKFRYQIESRPYDGLPPEGRDVELSDESDELHLIEHMLDMGELFE